MEGPGGLWSTAFDAGVDLGGVDADEANGLLVAASETDVNRVTVDDLEDRRLLPADKQAATNAS